MSSTIQLSAHERVTVVSAGPEALVVEAEYDPGGRRPPSHRHTDQDERFEVLAGVMAVETPDGERRYAAGETFEIPRGVAHRMANGGEEPARVRWETRPALRTESFWRAISAARTPLGAAVALVRFRREFRLARL